MNSSENRTSWFLDKWFESHCLGGVFLLWTAILTPYFFYTKKHTEAYVTIALYILSFTLSAIAGAAYERYTQKMRSDEEQ